MAELEIMLNSNNNLMADYAKYLITPKKPNPNKCLG